MNDFDPIIKSLMKELDCAKSHDGLDLRLKYADRDTHPQERGPRSYEIMNHGRPFGDDTFPAKSVRYLIDDVIKKYFEEKGSVKDRAQAKTNDIKAIREFKIVNGKHLSKIVENEQGGYDFHMINEDVDPGQEVKSIAADLWHLLAISKEAIEDKNLQVNNSMKVGTLDSDKDTKCLLIHTENGLVKYERDIVPKTLLLTTLWYMLGLHQTTKVFLKYINLEVKYKGYTAKVIKGEVTLDTSNVSELVKEIYTDLRRME